MRSVIITRVLLFSKWKIYKTCSLSPAFSKNDFRLYINWSTRSCSEVRCKSKYGLDVADSKNHGQRLSLCEDVEPVFQPKRAVILTKMTRFEYERKRCQSMTDNEFKEYVSSFITISSSHIKKITYRNVCHWPNKPNFTNYFVDRPHLPLINMMPSSKKNVSPTYYIIYNNIQILCKLY